jgi:hypothetical protein
MAYPSASGFLLPTVISLSWHYFNTIPARKFKPWYNPVDTDNRVPIFLNSLSVRIRLLRRCTDTHEEMFYLTAPGQTKFGKLFQQFIAEQNKHEGLEIECMDERQHPLGWEFFVQIFGGLIRNHLDTELSLRENKIKDNAIIIARRISSA